MTPGSTCPANKFNLANRAVTALTIQLNDNINHGPRIINCLMATKTQPCLHAHKGNLFTCISATGNTVFLSGKDAITYQISTIGAPAVGGLKRPLFDSAAGSAALRTLMTQSSNNIFEAEYNRVANARLTQRASCTQRLRPFLLPDHFGLQLAVIILQTNFRWWRA